MHVAVIASVFFHVMEHSLIHGIHGGGGLLGEILISLGCYISLRCQYIYGDDDDDDDDDHDDHVKWAQDYQRIQVDVLNLSGGQRFEYHVWGRKM